MCDYEWKRFWCPRGQPYILSNDGYLGDPDTKSGLNLNSHLTPLQDYSHVPCLVLLGEPGIGKSTEFHAAFSRLEAVERDRAILIDLKEYQTDSRLVSDAFENDAVREWREGQHILHVWFDSLDEGRLEIRNIASIIAGNLRRLKPHARRLRLRIACRTAEWSTSLESALKATWGEEAVEVIELAPLRRCDIVTAATVKEVEPDRFLNDVEAKSVQPFAINPIALQFLLDIHRQADALPSSKRQLYEQGCRRLCEESSQSRRDAGHFGDLSPNHRIKIASRIAAISIFCGRATIFTGQSPSTDISDLTTSDLVGGTERILDEHFEVTESAVRDVLSTMLFTGRGPERLGFAHHTYAEYLASRYVARRELDDPQIESLLFYPELNSRLVPQLTETAMWLALDDERVFSRVVASDPLALLSSDVAFVDDKTKRRLVDMLIAGFEKEELDDSDWNVRSHYKKLGHAGISDQLGPVIRDRSQNVVTRRFCIVTAEECHETKLLEPLCEVALDESDDPHIRAQASYAIIAIGDDHAFARLKPLAIGQSNNDPNDELHGNALRVLWPRKFITAEELFSHLAPPKQTHFIGAYRYFLEHELLQCLSDDDLPVALRWCGDLPPSTGETRNLCDVASNIVRRCVECIHRTDIRNALASYIELRIQHGEDVLLDAQVLTAVDSSCRRMLIRDIITRLADPTSHFFDLFFHCPALIQKEDCEWLLGQSSEAESEIDKQVWAKLAREVFLRLDQSQLSCVLGACKSNGVAAKVFADVIEPVELASPRASEMKDQYRKHMEWTEKLAQRQQPLHTEPPVESLVLDCLRQSEDGNLDAWVQLNDVLQMSPSEADYPRDFADDLTVFPGWSTADSAIRSRIVAAAQQYLSAWQSTPDEWIGTCLIHRSDFAGYRALVLVENLQPDFLPTMNAERWSNVAPSILGFPMTTGFGNEGEATQKRLARAAYEVVPDRVVDLLVTIIDRENMKEDRKQLDIFPLLDDCWDAHLTEALEAKVKDGHLQPWCVGDILDKLVSCGSADAIAYGESLVKQRADDRAREIARTAATVLWLNAPDRGWNLLWSEFQGDVEFFRNVITDAAFHHRQSRKPPAELSENELEELYLLLAQEFPHEDDPKHEGAYFVGPTDSVIEYRDGVLGALRDRGTPASCVAIERIKTAFPHLDFLDFALRASRRIMLRESWTPLSIEQLRELLSAPARRLVRTGRDLQMVILESINRLQRLLHGETPAVRDLWDHDRQADTWEPIDENAFSDYLVRHLRTDLANAGIVALREVQIRRGNDTSGETTDIYVAAVVSGSMPETYETVTVILEAKGCWHAEVKTAMQTQLKDRYLRNNDCGHGIYVVGWFLCESWNPSDGRRKSTPKWMPGDARIFFEQQAEQISDNNAHIEAAVIDSTLI